MINGKPFICFKTMLNKRNVDNNMYKKKKEGISLKLLSGKGVT